MNNVLNISRMTRADSPIYLSTIADETTLRKLHSRVDATALASSVFPVPVCVFVMVSEMQSCNVKESTWRAVEQDALWRLDAYTNKQFRVQEG